MKLKKGVFLHQTGDEYMGVTQDEAAKNFNGLIRNNQTADDIYKMLMTATTEESIVKAMCEKYDAPEDIISADVHELIEEIRKQGLLDE